MIKFGIDWSQPSTLRGMVWVLVAIIGLVGWWFGKDVTQLILLGAGVAGGLGVTVKDK